MSERDSVKALIVRIEMDACPGFGDLSDQCCASLDALKAMLAREEQAARESEGDYPCCDTCGKALDYMPWHYSKGDKRHLHACDECWAARAQGGEGVEPVGFIPSSGLNNLEAGHPARIYPMGTTPSPFEPRALVYVQPAQQGVPEGWRIRRMPYDTWEAGKIRVSSPNDEHCMVERRKQMASHHPMNMFYALAEALIPTPPEQESE